MSLQKKYEPSLNGNIQMPREKTSEILHVYA